LAIRIPKPVAEEAGVAEGDSVVIEAAEGRIQVRRHRQRVPRLRELVAQIRAKDRYTEIKTGPVLGKEEVEW
jgi:antitoxin component of MazEF toxin-antitoxin module